MIMDLKTEASRDQVEIILKTDAELTAAERVQYADEIRAILNVQGVEITELNFQRGSTIISICLLVGAGLGFCFTQFFGGAFKKLGERSAERLLGDGTKADASGSQLTPEAGLPIKNITFPELPEINRLNLDWSKETFALMLSAESAGQKLTLLMHNIPGVEKSITTKTQTFNEETQELIENIHQTRISKLSSP